MRAEYRREKLGKGVRGKYYAENGYPFDARDQS